MATEPIAILYEHADGRRAVVSANRVATFAIDNPDWHRAGPVEIVWVDEAAPTSSASVEITDEQMHQGLAAAFAHPRAAAPDAVFKAGVDFGVSVALLQTAPTTQATPQPAVQQGDELPREDFAWLVVQEACETEPADEDDPECIRILRRDLSSSHATAVLRPRTGAER